MSADPRTGVVDLNCRVHGFNNLYVASASVFPTTGSANPTLPVLAIALRLAEHISASEQAGGVAVSPVMAREARRG
jgi:choline dehydrogenase-like flavoprotein